MTALDQRSPSADGASGFLRELEPGDLQDLERLMLRDPDANVVVIERVASGGLEPQASGGRSYGWFENGELTSVLYVGANLAVIAATANALAAFAAFLRRRSRLSSAIVGFRDDVLTLWEGIEPMWGPCRELRERQPLLVMGVDPVGAHDQNLRKASLIDLEPLMQPSIDMFTEEVGVSPVAGGRGPAFRARIASSILEGRTYISTQGNRVVFKAEVGAAAAGSAQIQGVWLAPELRGQGLSVARISALVFAVRRDHASRVSLYVNDHNRAAYRAYLRVGFQQVATFATVLF